MAKPVISGAAVARLGQMHAQLLTASHIAKAAQACAEAGSLSDAITVSMDIEQLIYEACRFHDAASLLNRLAQG